MVIRPRRTIWAATRGVQPQGGDRQGGKGLRLAPRDEDRPSSPKRARAQAAAGLPATAMRAVRP